MADHKQNSRLNLKTDISHVYAAISNLFNGLRSFESVKEKRLFKWYPGDASTAASWLPTNPYNQSSSIRPVKSYHKRILRASLLNFYKLAAFLSIGKQFRMSLTESIQVPTAHLPSPLRNKIVKHTDISFASPRLRVYVLTSVPVPGSQAKPNPLQLHTCMSFALLDGQKTWCKTGC